MSFGRQCSALGRVVVECRRTSGAPAPFRTRADGLRGWKQAGNSGPVTCFFYDQFGTPLLETNSNNQVTAINTFGANGLVSRTVSGSSTFYTFDELGNTTERLDSNANVLSAHASDEYGLVQSSPSTPPNDPYYGFGAQYGNYHDAESGLYLMGQRYYNPYFARFVNADPIGQAGGPNTYAYAADNPMLWADPSGLLTIGGFEFTWSGTGEGLETGLAADGSSLSFHTWDGGRFKNEPGFATSVALADVGRDAALAAFGLGVAGRVLAGTRVGAWWLQGAEGDSAYFARALKTFGISAAAYEIGQHTLSGGAYTELAGMSPEARGAFLASHPAFWLKNLGWAGPGGPTFMTGPTPGVRYAVRGGAAAAFLWYEWGQHGEQIANGFRDLCK